MSPEYCVPLPLKAITDLFPPELKSTLRKNPSEHVHVGIPRSLIEPQLAGGAVRITFAQLRAATPEIFFHPQGGPADAKVSIPLDVILRELMPSRREDQREVSIPGNIPSVFGKAGPPAQARASATAEPWYSHRRPTYDGPGTEIPPDGQESPLDAVLAAPPQEEPVLEKQSPATPEPAPERVLKMPAVEMAPAKPAAAAPEPAAASILPMPAATAKPAPAAAEPAPASILPMPKPEPPAPDKTAPASTLPMPGAETIAPKRPFRDPWAKSAPAVVVPNPEAEKIAPESSAPKLDAPNPAAPDITSAAEDSVSIPLTTILPALPEGIRKSMNGLDAATRLFQIPLSEFETQMRSGKLRFKWSKLRGWCRPEPFATTAADVDVDLPLPELVPLFLATRKAPDARKKFEIDSRIPDIFGKSGMPAPTPAPAAEPAAEPAPVTAPEPEPEAKAAPSPVAAPEPIPEPVSTPGPAAPEPAPEAEAVPAPAVEPEPIPAPESAPVAETIPIPVAEPEPAPIAVEAAAPVQASEAAPEPVPFPAGGISDAPPAPHLAPVPTITPFRLEQAASAPAQKPGPSNPSTPSLQRIRALDGVSGAFLATADGLLIAADLPDGNENVLAAFAPTVFAQLAKYCDMAKLGLPLSIDLHLGATNIHVRKTGKIFLGVLTSHGRTLPLPELNLIAATLQPNAS